MQKSGGERKESTLDAAIERLEEKVFTLLSLYRDQLGLLTQLRKENINLKNQLDKNVSKLEVDEKLNIKVDNYISYIDTCIEYIEAKINE